MDPKKGVKWHSWDSLCKHKNDGGMGFHNLHIFNLVMLGKTAWKLQLNSLSLFVWVLKAKYYPNTDFFHANLGHNPSYTWRSIFSVRDLVKHGSHWKVCDGSSVHLWGDC